ncbi:metal ABC transporter permease [Thermodesulfobacterium thermophilum]|uniref:metal ABC transporter permease n=1 Tax=Thermodesulfobacterium thermophilum TaxID=886 RepID=UPI0003B7576B|nr:metal ABC transporter permease [Thermodesulfobacterium thermophilum]
MTELWLSLGLLKYGLLAGVFLGISFAFTSPFLVLKRNSLFPHALTHILFLAIILISIISEYFPDIFTYPLLEYPIMGLVTLFCTSLVFVLKRTFRLYEDTATSIIASLALGIALILITKTSQYDTRLLSYLFGSLMTVTSKDMFNSLWIACLTLLVFYKYYPLWITQKTDHEIPGVNFKWANFWFLTILTLQVFISIKLMGVLLVSSLFVFTSVLGLKTGNNVKQTIFLTALTNLFSILLGTIVSLVWDIPFSSAVVLCMSFWLLISFIMKRGRA